MNRGRDKERFDSHVEHSGNCGGCVVCVNAGKDKVSGKGGLYGDFRGFEIPYLSNQDYVGDPVLERIEVQPQKSVRSVP